MDDEETIAQLNNNLSKMKDMLMQFNRKLAHIERLERKLEAIENNRFLIATEKYFLMRDWSRGEAMPLIKGVREDISQMQIPFKEVIDKTRRLEIAILRQPNNNSRQTLPDE